MASQLYKTDASQEYVIVGNDAIVKCQYPSFVSDFLSVEGWQDSEGNFYSRESEYKAGKIGNSCYCCMSHVERRNLRFLFLSSILTILFSFFSCSSELQSCCA